MTINIIITKTSDNEHKHIQQRFYLLLLNSTKNIKFDKIHKILMYKFVNWIFRSVNVVYTAGFNWKKEIIQTQFLDTIKAVAKMLWKCFQIFEFLIDNKKITMKLKWTTKLLSASVVESAILNFYTATWIFFSRIIRFIFKERVWFGHHWTMNWRLHMRLRFAFMPIRGNDGC